METRRGCPYFFCSAIVTVTDAPTQDGEYRRIVKQHTIGHPVLDGPCIGSLVYLPVSDAQRELFAEREAADSERINRAIAYEPPPKPTKAKGDQSGSLRNPRRMGREPESDSADWALGGRADEEAQPLIINRPRTPIGVLGAEVGRHVATVGELAAATQEAALQGGEAIATLQRIKDDLALARESILEARNIVAGMLGDQSQSLTLQAYYNMLNNAFEEAAGISTIVEEVTNTINGAQEHGQDFLNRLYG